MSTAVLLVAAAVVAADDRAVAHVGIWLAIAGLAVVGLARPHSRIASFLPAAVIGLAAMASLPTAAIAVTLAVLAVAIATWGDERPTRATVGALAGVGGLAIVLTMFAIGSVRTPTPSEAPAVAASDAESREARSASVSLPTVDSNTLRVQHLPPYDALGFDDRLYDVLVYDDYPAVMPTRNVDVVATDDGDPNSLLLALLVLAGFVTLALAWFGTRSARRARLEPLTDHQPDSGEDSADVVVWYDAVVARAGHPRRSDELILAHSRRAAAATGDERFLTLGRLVARHVYGGQELPSEALRMFRD